MKKTNRIESRRARSTHMEALEGRTLYSVAAIVVNTPLDRVDPASSSIVSLRDAIDRADVSKTPTTIMFSPTVFGSAKTISLTLGELQISSITEPVKIVGPTAGVTISGANHSRDLLIDARVNCSIANLVVSNGTAVNGGGIFNSGSLTLNNVTVSNNKATSTDGGGIDNYGTISLADVTLSANSANNGDGGGIVNYGKMSLVNVTVANNTANSGGGVSNDAPASMTNVTICGNSATGFGGGLCDFPFVPVTIGNSVIAGNTAGYYAQDAYGGAITSSGYNLIGNSTGCSADLTSTDLSGTVANPLSADLSPLGNNGGLTQTMLPLLGSPVIGNGSVALIPSGITTDQRGFPRTRNGTVDIGAFELQFVPISVSITTRYGDELVITATGADDSVSVSETGSELTIIADGQTFNDVAPAGGVFVYARGGEDCIRIASSVTAQTTIDTIYNTTNTCTINSLGANVIAWVNSTDTVTGTASVHAVASFAGGVNKTLGASLPDPTDSGPTTTANLSLFGTGPVAGDVNQGAVGDCYFLASLAAFAKTSPQTILNSAVDLGDGTYAVEFYQNGNPEFIRVNNTFSEGGFGGFNFAHPGSADTTWAMVMEKAFAYLRTGANTYASISGGWMNEVYSDLNVQSVQPNPSTFSDAQIFSMFNSDLEAGEPVTFATFASPPNLVGDHAYTLMGIEQVNGVNEYVVRNPWGVSGDTLENSQGIATLTYAQLIANFYGFCEATS